MGDELFVAVAKRLKNCIRPDDIVSRFGGDEFMVLIKECKEMDEATTVADRIQKGLRSHFRLGRNEVFVTTSIGIALRAPGYENGDDILRDADSAMYRAKALGRARYELFDMKMYESAIKLLQLEADLRCTVKKKDFLIYYQPIISVIDKSIVGAEAGVRWEHPEMGMISPLEFIPLAEETGLISAIGKWVLRTACAQNKKWQDDGYGDLLIKVNFSVSQFYHQDTIQLIKDVLNDTGMSAELLDVEVTESIAAEGHSIYVLNKLSEMNVNISIDDFGTGFSSLGSLKDLPINTIKIDKSFITDIGSNPNATAIVKAIIAMSHNLNMKALAEGVETEEQYEFLKAHYCEEMQGFLFSAPVPADKFIELFDKKALVDPIPSALQVSQVLLVQGTF